jgi:TrmH family RNA methyltransferase
MTPTITSLQNPLVRQILRLQQKPAERRKTGLFVAEGRREVSLALRHGAAPEHVLVCPEIFRPDPLYPIPLPDHPVEVSQSVYNKLAYRENQEGVLLLGRAPATRPQQLDLSASPLLLILEGIEKPGNLGAILRTADAAGADAVLVCGTGTDVYNPNVIRSSLGCVFTRPVIRCSNREAMEWLEELRSKPSPRPWKVYAAALQDAIDYYEAGFTGPTALLFGAEDKGLSDGWRAMADNQIRIPMAGAIDSLNVAASAAILCFEAVRQRLQAPE